MLDYLRGGLVSPMAINLHCNKAKPYYTSSHSIDKNSANGVRETSL